MPNIVLTVNGARIDRWTGMRYFSDLESPTDSFALQLIRPARGAGAMPPIQPNDFCTFSLEGVVLITGYIDSTEYALDGENLMQSVTGRDGSADMVDCSAIHTPGEWKKYSLYDLAVKLCTPFRIGVSHTTDATASVQKLFDLVALESGETAYECIERHARQRGLLLRADGIGGTQFYTPGGDLCMVQIEQGKNLVSLTAALAMDERFSSYKVRAQSQATSRKKGETVTYVTGEATDAKIERTRTKLINAERGLSPAEAKNRALWEASVRASRSVTVTARLRGWEQAPKTRLIWKKGDLVNVESEACSLSATLMIASVELELGNDGAITTLKLCPVGAYDPEPDNNAKNKKVKKDSPKDRFILNDKGFYDVIRVQ